MKTPVQPFMSEYFPQAAQGEWDDWRWQSRNRLRDLEGLEGVFELTDDEREAILKHKGALPAGITPYYASLISPTDPDDPLRRTMIPSMAEYDVAPGERDDPLGEEDHSPMPGLVHTYPDKILFLVTDFCATYCRYCTRSRMVGGGEFLPEKSMWSKALAYIEEHKEVRDVLLSGGDPLVLADDRLEWLLERLHAIPHVEFIRIGTKIPAVLPQRITPELVSMLRKYHPLWMSIHFTHPNELTPESARACARLADAGIPMGSQTVLLRGVNDDVDVMKDLMVGLLKLRVRPYYIHQCDPVTGSSHFKVPVEQGLEILKALHGHTTGYAVPHYMIDAPGGGGKVPISPDYVVGREGGDLLLRSYNGKVYRYPDEQAVGKYKDEGGTMNDEPFPSTINH